MKFELNKDQIKQFGKGAGKIGKAIIVEGTKAVALKGAAAVITQSFDEGFGKVKELSLDDMLKGGKKHNKPKKPKTPLFSFERKDKTEELTDGEKVVIGDAIKESIDKAVDNIDYREADKNTDKK